jgi:hypothetical protein
MLSEKWAKNKQNLRILAQTLTGKNAPSFVFFYIFQKK